ncbi:hypothetical protein HanRHA438_Chr15g0733401 [Helianthus annuus]|nr:hypothetical protein HanRHA438_Chr15g0733401 [Helianthus annuus]
MRQRTRILGMGELSQWKRTLAAALPLCARKNKLFSRTGFRLYIDEFCIGPGEARIQTLHVRIHTHLLSHNFLYETPDKERNCS